MYDKKYIPLITRGFTLMEVIAVLILISILAAVAIPKYVDMRDSAGRKTAHVVTSALDASLHLLYAENMAAGAAGPAYNMADIVDHAKIDPAILFTIEEPDCKATIGNIEYTWTLDPAPNLPDETGGIVEESGW